MTLCLKVFVRHNETGLYVITRPYAEKASCTFKRSYCVLISSLRHSRSVSWQYCQTIYGYTTTKSGSETCTSFTIFYQFYKWVQFHVTLHYYYHYFFVICYSMAWFAQCHQQATFPKTPDVSFYLDNIIWKNLVQFLQQPKLSINFADIVIIVVIFILITHSEKNLQ